jgi:alpha-glucoside transport system substrate-binding protein
LAGEFKGTKVTATGPFVDADAQKFDATVKDFEDKTGIDIQYQGSKEFEASIKAAMDSGTAPDIIDFPQPGLLATFARQGKIQDVSQFLNPDALKQSYNQSWLDMAMMPGQGGSEIMAGVWERVNGKSLVWYPKKAWDEAGYKIPTTWEEMKQLMDDMVSDGSTPWCVGIESGAATGWPATDWMEELMLRTTSPENYDKWVAGELKFASPEVKKAAEAMTDIWQDKYVYGGQAGIVKTNFGDAPLPMFDPTGPKCWMHKQGNFITSFFPEGTKAGVDYDFFYFPGLDPAYGKPVLVAGDIWAATTDRPEVKAVMELFTKGEHLKEWMKQGGAIAPHLDADLAWYGSDIERNIGKIIQEATAVRFDASDLMPGQVGAGSFWKEMTSYVAGAVDLDTALKNIDASWPGAAPSAAPSTPQSFLERALAGEFKGTKVTATGPFVDADAQKFDATVKDFEDKTGIDIQYQGSKEFEASIKAAMDSGTAPDIIDFPQPGLLATFARQGKIQDVSQFLNPDALKQSYNQSWLDMAMMPGQGGSEIMAGVWERVNGKSLVWYPKKAWDEAGYKIPTTWEEMKQLMDDMVSDGSTPWCVGIESGAATGWPATDWMEELMLRTTSPENYDKWVAGELKFASPEVKKAAEAMTDIWQDKYVYGGQAGIVKTNFGDAPLPMFDPTGPKCWMHKQGNFITSFFPEGTKAGVDYDFFYFPGLDPAYGKPVLVAGDIWAATTDRPEVKAVMELFTKGEHLKEWMKQGGAIAPHLDADLAWYGSDIERNIGKIIQEATAVRFDASDLMPGQVGAGSFWKEMTSYVAGAVDLDTALKNIDASWPK